jgi:L-2-hydroxycarboxylate dehydrogenase (NAD+)
MTIKSQKFNQHKARALIHDSFVKMGFKPGDADGCAEVMITADLFGIRTHGISFLCNYIRSIREGRIDPSAEPIIEKETAVSCLMDANGSMGHSSALKAMQIAIDKAEANGIGVTLLRNANHYGPAGYYPYFAAKKHLFGFTACNTEPHMVPINGKFPMLGANPIAFAMPAEPYPFLLDMSTTVIPRGKLEMAARNKETLAADYAIDSTGALCRDAARVSSGMRANQGGGILPLGGLTTLTGGHKGYGLALVVEIISGVFAQSLTSDQINLQEKGKNKVTQIFAALNYGMFGDPEVTERVLSEYMARIRGSVPLDPAKSIYTSGQIEMENYARNLTEGIFIGDKLYGDLMQLCESFGFDSDAYLERI